MTVRVFDEAGRELGFYVNVPDVTGEILDLVAFAIDYHGKPDQAFKVRVEDENHSGYWMVVRDLGGGKPRHA
jgi:hypothetical protein